MSRRLRSSCRHSLSTVDKVYSFLSTSSYTLILIFSTPSLSFTTYDNASFLWFLWFLFFFSFLFFLFLVTVLWEHAKQRKTYADTAKTQFHTSIIISTVIAFSVFLWRLLFFFFLSGCLGLTTMKHQKRTVLYLFTRLHSVQYSNIISKY